MSTDVNTGPETGSPGNDSKAAPAAADVTNVATLNGGTQTPAANEAPLTAPHWSALDAGSQEIVRKNGWADKGADEVLKAYDSLASKLGTAVQVPGADATPEQVSEFYAKLGRPEDPTKYTVAEEWTKKPGYSQSMTEAFQAKCFELGMSQKQFEEIAKWSIESGTAAIEGQQETLSKRAETALNELTKSWGSANDPAFKKNVDYADTSITKLDPGLRAELASLGAIGPNSEILAPTLMKALATVGKMMFSEDASVGRHDAVTTNPFDPKTMDIDLAARLVREAKADKSGARRQFVVGLMRAHNVNPASYQL